MTLITLNIWRGGKVLEPLKAFIKKHAKTVDIFCFQEVFDNGQVKRPSQEGNHLTSFGDITALLLDHEGYFVPAEEPDQEGLAMFAKRSIHVEKHDSFYVHESKNDETQVGRPRKLEYMQLQNKKNMLTIANLHGLYTGGGKDDTPERIMQSQKVKEFFTTTSGPKILAGDFNLTPETKSFTILAKGMRDLVAESKITCTRTPLYRNYKTSTHFADYILVSPDVHVQKFNVLQDIVSDHLPLFLEFT
ncbi:MAG: endonuclease/exonuclease/phosphatase family protein [bacterium]|nr:endonuclease/exonuclease/phosphatase family protein [bacterium]